MGELLMPSLGADMDAGTVIEWLVKPGDLVQRGDIVAVVDTDKADVDIETFEAGTIDELLVPIGLKVPVGTPLARLAGAAAARTPVASTPPSAPTAAQRATAVASASRRSSSRLARRGAAGLRSGRGARRGALATHPPARPPPRCGPDHADRQRPRRIDHAPRRRASRSRAAGADRSHRRAHLA